MNYSCWGASSRTTLLKPVRILCCTGKVRHRQIPAQGPVTIGEMTKAAAEGAAGGTSNAKRR